MEVKKLVTIPELIEEITKRAEKEGHAKEKVKPAMAVCRDDSVKQIEIELQKSEYLEAFNMNTLSGLPVFGNTGAVAFYHHIPDHGMGLIIYAPHIGKTETGELGYLNRKGIEKPGKSCGANHAIIGKWQAGDFGPYEGDPELSQVSAALADVREEILKAENPLVALTEAEYTKGLEMIKEMVERVQKSEAHQYPVLIVAGIHIDQIVDRKDANQFDLREIGIFEKGEYRVL